MNGENGKRGDDDTRSEKEWQTRLNEILRKYGEVCDGGNARYQTLSNNDDGVSSSSDLGDIHSNHRNRMRLAATLDPELNGFRDVELIELLLSFFVPQRDTNPTAHALIDKFGSALEALRAPYNELVNVKCVTKSLARVLPSLFNVINQRLGAPVTLADHFAAAEYFGLGFLAENNDGVTFSVCMNSNGRISGIERCAGNDILPFRSVFDAVGRYNPRKLLLVRRERGIFPDVYALTSPLAKLAFLTSEVGVRLIDFILFTDYGYYTLGNIPTDKSDWSPQFVFVPIELFESSPQLVEQTARKFLNDVAAAIDEK